MEAAKLSDVLNKDKSSDNEDIELPVQNIEFEFSDHDDGDKKEHSDHEGEEEEEEEFNLFGSAVKVDLKNDGEKEDPRVYAKRSDSYYFAKYNDEEKRRFAESAVDGVGLDFIYDALIQPHRVINYTKLAQKAKLENARMHRRPGKKTRELRAKRRPKNVINKSSIASTDELKFGPEREHANAKINGRYDKRNINRINKNNKKIKRGVSGQGGHPRKGAQRAAATTVPKN